MSVTFGSKITDKFYGCKMLFKAKEANFLPLEETHETLAKQLKHKYFNWEDGW